MRSWPFLWLLAALGGCGGEGSTPAVRVLETRDLGPLAFAPSIRGRDGGHSAHFGGRSVWTFGDTMLDWANASGESWLNSTFTTSLMGNPAEGLLFEEPLDSTGAPSLLIPWTPEESAHNAARSPPDCQSDCAPKWVIWPGPLVVDPSTGEGLLFYMKHRNWVDAGKSIARWRSPDSRPERVAAAAGAEPTLLFPEGDVEPTSAALAVGEWLYAYDCREACILGRVRFTEAFVRSAWTFFAGEGGWIEDHRGAVPVLKTRGMFSVHHNEHLERYVAIYGSAGNTAVLRTAPNPEGPWSREVEMTGLLAPAEGDLEIYDVLAHGELAQDRGRRTYFSYSRPTAPFRSELRLVEVVLERP